MFCTNCGNYNPEEARNCSSCGMPLNRCSEPGTEQGNASCTQPDPNPYMMQQPVQIQQYYGQPPCGQTPYGQLPYGQPPYGQPPYGQSPYGQPPFGQSPTTTERKSGGKGAGIASLVLGILSLVLFCVPVAAGIFSLVGTILGIVSISKSSKAGRVCGIGIAGLICSSVGLFLALIFNIAFFAPVTSYSSTGYSF